MFNFIKTLDGSAPVTSYLALDQVAIVKGDVVFWQSSGFIGHSDGSSHYTQYLAGVAEATKATANWASGATIAVQTNHAAIYRVDSTAAVVASDAGENVGVRTGDLTVHPDIIDTTEYNDNRGVVKILRIVTTSGTSQTADVILNFASPSHDT